MLIPELKKIYTVTLFNKKLLITTLSNNNDAFEANLNTKHQIKIGWHDCIETSENSLNYYECCGILKLFGINPPTFEDLCSKLKI